MGSPILKTGCSRRAIPGLWVAGLALLPWACDQAGPTASEREPGIRILTETKGRKLDPDGYQIVVDGTHTLRAEVNGVITVTDVLPGLRAVELAEVAENCTAGDHRLIADVPATTTVSLAFYVVCVAPIPPDIEIAFVRDGVVHGMRADGSGITDLLGHVSGSPAWSPDATRLAFSTTHGDPYGNLYVMNVDGTEVTRLTNAEAPEGEPSWSPDGRQLAYRRGGHQNFARIGDDTEIYLIDLEERIPMRLSGTPDQWESRPAWSPDGAFIAFERLLLPEETDVYAWSVADNAERNLTNDRRSEVINREPSWSPDGTKIVFRRAYRTGSSGYDIWIMNRDGTNQQQIVRWPDPQINPRWSPDGEKIIFSSGSQLWTITLDGTAVRLTSGFIDGSPSWRRRETP